MHLIILTTIFILSNGFPIDSPYSIDMSTEKKVMDATTEAPPYKNQVTKNIQCAHKFQKLINNKKGCVAESDEPLICLRGELILKINGDGKEMCCCNY